MDVAVDATRGHNHVLARDHFGGCPDHQFRIDALHRIGISGLAGLHDPALSNADVRLHNAPMVDDQRVGDDQIEGARGAVRRGRVLVPCRPGSPCRLRR